MKKNAIQRLFAIAMALVLALSLAACGGQPQSSAPASDPASPASPAADGAPAAKEPVTLRFYNYALSETAKADWWQSTIADFQKENDWVNIETITVDYNSMVSTFTNDLASGLSVDLVYGEVSWVPALVEGGFIQPPKDVLSADFYGDYYSYVMDQFQYNGNAYGVPHYYTNSVIFVNKDLVTAAGLKMEEFPTTLDGLKSWIETLNDYYKGNDSVTTTFGLTTAEVPATGANINAIYTAFGGTLINDDGTLADLNAEPNRTAMHEALDFYKYLLDTKSTQENLKLKDYRAAFGAGNVCMYVDSSWGYAQIGEVDANAKNFTVTAPLPTTMGTNGKGASLVESHCFLIGSNLSDGQKEAVDLFIQHCTKNETMEGYLNNIGLAFVANKRMESCPVSPILEGAAKGVDNVVRQPQIAPIISVQTELASMVLNYAVNGMSADDAIAEYVKQAEYYINQ